MTRFYELINECNIDNIKYYLKSIYKINDNDLDNYLNWYRNITKIEPNENDNIIFSRKDEWYDVFYIKGDNSDIVESVDHYSITHSLFKDLFGMYYYNDNNLTKEEFVISVLYENTFYGYTDKDKLKHLRKIGRICLGQ